MTFRFGNPWLLLLLAGLLPLVAWTGARLALLTHFRRALILGTRLAIIALLVLALARIQIVRSSDFLDVFFVLDGSDSIPEAQKQEQLTFLQNELKKMKSRDRAGILVFGRFPAIEEIPSYPLEVQDLLSEPDRTGTDIGEALRLAMAALTGENKKRIVLLSDGNENEGSAIEAARSASAHHVPVDVVPVTYEYRHDAIVESLSVDSRVHVNEPFDVKVFVRTDEAGPARLNVFCDSQLLNSQDVRLEAGKKNAFVLTSQVAKAGFHTYRVQVESPGDRNLANNEGNAFTFAAGPPRILFVDGNPPDQNRIVPVLQSEKIEVDYTDAGGLPDELGALQGYDSVVLSNVGADEIGERRMKAIETAVHELGVGLVMVGGPDSFGAGGYQDTPVERALPVSMEVAHKRILPRGALVLILHTCEIPQGNYWAREIALAALDVMSSRDLLGVLYFGVPSGRGGGVPSTGWGEQWLFTLQEVGDKSRMRTLIKECQPGDMPFMQPTLQMAHGALSTCNASVKHIVIITDGDPTPASTALLQQIKDSNITLSTVGIAPHNPATLQILQAMAGFCGGNFYDVKDFKSLPQIFIKEASIVRKPLICEEPFTPILKTYSPLMAGISDKEIPQLKGYVCSTVKALAETPLISDKDDPVLAHWQYGVGKSVAFTSDAQAKWATSWIEWNKFAKFWTQLVRWTLRGQLSQNLQMHTEIAEGKGHVVVDAVDAQGNFINFVEFQASIINPKLERQPLALKQTGPGRYEATFPIEATGSYMVTARSGEKEEGAGGLITGGLAMSYSPEYKNVRSNEGLLKQVASLTGGREGQLNNNQVNLFDHNLPSGSKPEPLWPNALALAILLVPLDVFFRRVMIDWRDVARGWAVARDWTVAQIKPLFARRPREREQAMDALLQVKEKVREQTTTRAPSEAFLEALHRAKQQAHGDVLDQSEVTAAASQPVVVRKSEKEELRKPKAPAEAFTTQLLEAKKRVRSKKA